MAKTNKFYYYNDKLRVDENHHVEQYNVDARRWEKARIDRIRGVPMVYIDDHYIRVTDLLETAKVHIADPFAEKIESLREQGYSQKDIAIMTGETTYKVRKYLKETKDYEK